MTVAEGAAEPPRRRAVILAACAVLVPGTALIAPLGIAPLFALAAAAVLALDGRGVLRAAWPLAPFAVIAALLGVWATLSAAWSVIPLHSFLEGLRFLLEAAGGLLLLAASIGLAPRERRLIGSCAAVGLALAILFGLHEALTGASFTEAILGRSVPMTRLDRGATTLALALWPVLLTARRRLYAAIFALGAVATIYLLFSTGALLALLVGFAAFALAWAAPRGTAAALALGIVLFAAAAPFAVPPYRATIALHHAEPELKWSGIHRLLIWRFTALRIAERPLLGWGMDASRAIPGGNQYFADLFPDAGLPKDATTLPLHPHNGVLQWELELGFPGTGLALALVVLGLWRVGAAAELSRAARAGALAWAAAALVIALLAYGIWQAWWVSTLFLSASLVSAAAGDAPRESGDTRAPDPP